MEITELSVLRTGVTLFVGAINEIAKRANCSQAYVTRTLKGEAGDTPLTRAVIEVTKQVYLEKSTENQEYSSQLGLASCR